MAQKVTQGLLIWLVSTYHGEPFRRKDAVQFYTRTAPENIPGLFGNLKRWGCIRYVDRKKRGWGGYIVTEWGKKMAQKWRGG